MDTLGHGIPADPAEDSQITIRQWFALPKAERRARAETFRAADEALQANGDAEQAAGIREETGEYHRLNGRVNDLWPTVVWWIRDPALPHVAADIARLADWIWHKSRRMTWVADEDLDGTEDTCTCPPLPAHRKGGLSYERPRPDRDRVPRPGRVGHDPRHRARARPYPGSRPGRRGRGARGRRGGAVPAAVDGTRRLARTTAKDGDPVSEMHWIITLQSTVPPGTSKGTIAGANTFTAGATRDGIFNWVLGNARKQLAEADPAFRSGAAVVLFFSLEPNNPERAS